MHKNSKKAQGIVEIFAWMLAVFITIAFFLLFNLPGCDKTPVQKIQDSDLSYLRFGYDLSGFMRTPIEHEGGVFTASELIVYAMENETFRKESSSSLKKTAEYMLESYAVLASENKKVQICYVSLDASLLDVNLNLARKNIAQGECTTPEAIASASVPSTNLGNISVVMKISFHTGEGQVYMV